VITKPLQHDIDYAGEGLLHDVSRTLGWVANKVERDYGIDFEVQVFDGPSPSGAWFLVQLKSSSAPNYSADGSYISVTLEIDHARHFALELLQPMFIVVADVSAKRVFWHSPQLDRQLLGSLEERQDAKYVNLRVPITQELPASAPGLLTALDHAYTVLAGRRLSSTSATTFAESLNYVPDKEQLNLDLQKKSDIIKLHKMGELYSEGKYEEARTRLGSILGNLDSDVETKFWAQIHAHSIEYRAILFSGRPQIEIAKQILEHAKALQKLTFAGPASLKFYSLISRKAAELEILVHGNFGLSMLQKAHVQAGGNPLMVLGIYGRRSALSKAISAKYNQCVRLAQYAANYPDRMMLGRALTNILNAIAHYLPTLHFDGNLETEIAFIQSAFQIGKLAAWVSREADDENGVAMAALSTLLLVRTPESDIYQWSLQTAQTIEDSGLRESTLEGIERNVQRWNGERVEGDYSGDTLWQVIQNMATSSNIDISDENSPFVRALRIAAKDDSPERVLIHCEHLLVSIGAIGPLARHVNDLFNMKTAASKVVNCTLHNFHFEAKELDSAYEQFEQTYCSKCKDQKPRAGDWKYDGKATPDEALFLTNLFGTPYDSRWSPDD
jgi:hypothetical protein